MYIKHTLNIYSVLYIRERECIMCARLHKQGEGGYPQVHPNLCMIHRVKMYYQRAYQKIMIISYSQIKPHCKGKLSKKCSNFKQKLKGSSSHHDVCWAYGSSPILQATWHSMADVVSHNHASLLYFARNVLVPTLAWVDPGTYHICINVISRDCDLQFNSASNKF